MKHLEFEFFGQRYSLTGNVITVYDNGKKVEQSYYDNDELAKIQFLELYDFAIF